MALLILFAIRAWERRWITDDGYINLRVVQQLFAGNGPVFNAGERVEVATGTIWLWLVALLSVPAPERSGEVVVIAGWLISLIAVLLAVLASRELSLHRGDPATTLALPLGLVVVAIPQFADFATSGLENSTTFAWLAACFFGLARTIRTALDTGAPVWLAVCIGLGWLIRPDVALYSAAFAGVLLVTTRRGRIRSLLVAAVIPVGYQIFRMGYYAALVPNTALAKNASESQWELGLNYLQTFAGRYALPIALVLIAAVVLSGTTTLRGLIADRRAAVLVVAVMLAAVLHTVYIVRVGGDFMFGRFLLAPLFALLLPFAVGFIDLGSVKLIGLSGLALLVVWAGSANSVGRAPMLYGHGVQDERVVYTQFYVDSGMTWRPADWSGQPYCESGRRAAVAQTLGTREYLELDGTPYPLADGYEYAIAHNVMGITSVAAGPQVTVIDNLALADPIAARTEWAPGFKVERIGHVGHEPYWRIARYAAPSAMDSDNDRLARTTLSCGQLRRLRAAISEPMTLRRFVRNVRSAPSLTRLTIPSDLGEAHRKFCR